MKRSKYIDHTLLKADACKDDILNLCEEAKQYDFASVCVNPCWVKTCYEALKVTDINVCTVIGFPLGSSSTETKVFEASDAIKNGADEIDMVINIGQLKDKNFTYIENEIREVRKVCSDAVLKVIIECCLLNDDEKIMACTAAKNAGADFVKTSTGFAKGGAVSKDVALMKSVIGKDMKVKASGGIRTKESMDEMIEAGAERIGTSSGISLV